MLMLTAAAAAATPHHHHHHRGVANKSLLLTHENVGETTRDLLRIKLPKLKRRPQGGSLPCVALFYWFFCARNLLFFEAVTDRSPCTLDGAKQKERKKKTSQNRIVRASDAY